MKKMLRATMIALTTAPFAVTLVPAAYAKPADAVCMARTSGNQGNSREQPVLATPQTAGDLAARGFVARPCGGRQGQYAEYRAKVCNAARSVPQGAQDAFRASQNVSLAELCAMAGHVMDD